MNITSAALKRNRLTIVALVIILLGGLRAYGSLSRSEDPGFIIRFAQIVTLFPGASPERVEMLVTDKLEKAIMEMPELDYVASESKAGVSVIYVIIKQSYDHMRPIWDDLRRKVDRAASDLPADVIGPTVDDEFGDVFGTVITITGEGFTYAELKEVADEARDEMLLIEEVAKVDIFGAQEERVFVEYNNARLSELGMSPLQLGQILESRNIVLPGGEVTTGVDRIVLEPSGNFETIEDLRQSVISLPGTNEFVYLEDIATIERGYIDPPQSKVTATGAPALAIAISLREGGNIITLGERVQETRARLQTLYPIGIEFDLVAFEPAEVDRAIGDFVSNLQQAVIVVVLVMLLFLGLRTGLVVASLIPTAIIMALLVMSVLDIGLNIVSLAALIISLGLLVDNAIVMVESIQVQMSEGKSAYDSAIDSARELRVPLLIASLTTIAAFLPIYLAESDTGEYVAPLFKVVTITLLCSWLLALTMVPLLAVRYVRSKTDLESSKYERPLYRRYRGALIYLLRNRLLTVAAAMLLFLAAGAGMGLVPQIFFPTTDKAFFKAEFELPIGTPIERTEEVVAGIERFITNELLVSDARTEGVTSWASFIGQGGPRFLLSFTPEPPSPNYAFSLVNVTSDERIEDYIARIDSFTFENYPDLTTTIARISYGPPLEAPVQVRILGRDPDIIFSIVDRVKAELQRIPGTRNITDNWGRRTKKLLVKVSEPRARRAGVTNQDIALSLQAGLSGFAMSDFREEDELIPITVRSVAADRQDVGKLEGLNVYAQASGESVPLKQVADIEIAWEPAKIMRRDRLKTVTVSAHLLPGHTAFDVVAQLRPWLQAESADWGLGYRWEIGGEVETSGEANASIMAKLPIAMLVIIMLLVIQFNSIRRPIIILLTIPLGVIGVTIGLLVARSSFGFMALLGIIALAGIVINNAIVLIDRIEIESRERGLELRRAIIEAAQRRLRPILLTTATTVCGLVPLWLGGGPMWEPMAIAIIFGLLFATLLTLGLVPVLYALFFRINFKGFSY
ncbi:MAG: efflux RND transporter permease subunit [Gemmatimonadota bacterium]|nr:MAG: efflux RND transporter permease subunit [Gemmatimonadota bacterium]